MVTGSDFQAYSTKSARTRHRLVGTHEGEVTAIDLNPDGSILASVGEDNMLKIFDILSGREIDTVDSQHSAVNDAKFSPDGQKIVTVGRDGIVKIWQLKDTRLLLDESFKTFFGSIGGVHYGKDGQSIFTLGQDEVLRTWDLSGRQIAQYHDRGGILSFDISPDGLTIVTAGEEGVINVRDILSPERLINQSCSWLSSYLGKKSVKESVCQNDN